MGEESYLLRIVLVGTGLETDNSIGETDLLLRQLLNQLSLLFQKTKTYGETGWVLADFSSLTADVTSSTEVGHSSLGGEFVCSGLETNFSMGTLGDVLGDFLEWFY